MAKIQWQKIYSVNIPEIDEQHKKLVSMINQLEDSLAAGKGIINKEIGIVLAQLVDYTQSHFKDEERLQEEMKFSKRVKHKQQHEELVQQIKAILINLKNGKPINAYEMMNFLRDWLVNHILEEDHKMIAEYKQFIQTHGNFKIKQIVNS